MLQTPKVIAWIKTAILTSIAFFAPVHKLMYMTVILIGFDLVTGLWAAVKRKERISSTKLRRTVAKTIAYQTAIMLSAIVEWFFLPEIPSIRIVSAMIGITEATSVLENLESVTGLKFREAVISKLQGKRDEQPPSAG